ncbi:uncharacterized protein LOC130441436 [Diorhabda sublineata]|uniref:uncharacterized protein LOC130441436 n=1 Tax=Diorhabda sublineata TaxID=1163346 RepID=UPI0024E172C3|nr:uncharacterized protein LOC130441436 [Diorhabda sublineata]XP_056631103.1 uncharacterized protein LOC130441436 [Diorhabda sublineata]
MHSSRDGEETVFGSESFRVHSISNNNRFYSTAVTTVIEDTLSQLIILKNLNNRNTTYFDNYVIEYKTVGERFSTAENLADVRLPSVDTNYDKLANDINCLVNVFRETSQELTIYETYSTLRRYVTALIAMEKDNKKLIDSQIKNKNEIKKLKELTSRERDTRLNEIHEIWEQIQDMKLKIDSKIIFGRYEIAFYQKWEKTRGEQNNMVCKEYEAFHMNTINEMREKIDLEMKCHLKFNTYIEESRNDMIDQINYWVKYYDDETERRESEMIKMKASLESLTKEHEEVMAEYEKRQEEMAKWKEYKKLRSIKKKRAKIERWASMVIQAWWRGMMVRKRLGPYKKRKGMGKKQNK